MAKVGDRIAKVVCKRCNGQHLYRTEQSVEAAKNGTTGTSATRARSTTSSRGLRAAAAAEPPPLPAFDPSKPPRAYSVQASFAAGERVTHPTFGTGVVAGLPGPGKVEIAFPTGRRVLASAKAVSTLERPALAQFVPIADRPPDKL